MLKEVDNKEVIIKDSITESIEQSAKVNPINPNGIRIDGAFSCFSDLPNDGSISTALVNGIFYYYDTDQDQWIRGGNVQGAKGEKGDKGDKGDPGKDLRIDGVFTHDDELPQYVEGKMETIIICERLHVYDKQTREWKDVGQIKGKKGDKGDKGDRGPVGPPVSVWHGSQAEYDELPVKNPNTFYLITSLF